MSRRQFLVMVGAAGAALAGYGTSTRSVSGAGAVSLPAAEPGEDVFAYIDRTSGGFDHRLYQQVIGAANDFKEGDQAVRVAATDEATRANARALLANTRIRDLHDRMPKLMSNRSSSPWARRSSTRCRAPGWAPASSRTRRPTAPTTSPGRSSAPSPTPPATSSSARTRWTAWWRASPRSRALEDIVDTFGLQDMIPWCVLSHIDVQAEVARLDPELAATMFQSLAGTDDCNKTFDVTVTGGRVRADYRIGETLFANADPNSFRGILHVIGERSGTMHHVHSVYITVARGRTWAKRGSITTSRSSSATSPTLRCRPRRRSMIS